MNTFARLELIGSVKRPFTEVDIQLAQDSLGIKFPSSYLDFIQHFGVGLLSGLFVVYTPNKQSPTLDITQRNRDLADRMYANTNYKQNFVLFGKSENGDLLCWDTSVQSDGEFPIILLGHEGEFVPKIATNLYDFVNNVCIGQNLDLLYPQGEGSKWDLASTFKCY